MLGLSASTSSSIGCGATATGASTSATSADDAGDSAEAPVKPASRRRAVAKPADDDSAEAPAKRLPRRRAVAKRRTHAERGGAPGSIAYRVLNLAQVPVLMYLPDR